MSFLQAYNYSFVPNAPAGFPQGIPPFGSSSFNTYNTPLNTATTIPIPQSIIPNPNSNTDYYGNPNELSNGNNPNAHQLQLQSEQQRQTLAQLQQQQQLTPLQQQQLAHQQQQQYLIHQQQQLAKQQQLQQRREQQQQQDQQHLQQLPSEQPPQQDYGQQVPQQDFAQQQQQQQQPQNSPPRKKRPKNSARARNAPPFINTIPTDTGVENTFGNEQFPRVTPIQGPIFAKDGFVPVVPLYSYPHTNNGTFYQIPILWTALSYALGLEIRGEILRGLPCIKRLNQLFCPTAGNTYPLNNIERFIDENKALIKRMYGEFVMNPESYVGSVGGNNLRRSAREIYEDDIPDFFGRSNTKRHTTGNGGGNGTSSAHKRTARQTVNPRNGGPTQQPKSNRVDSCESTVEIVTPYWAANSSGKVRAIVNTQHFEQAIHQEVCAKGHTKKCNGECGCEQKYKWHRLLAYDPDNDCRGIFMDWFLFPSCCVCRCNP